MTATVTTVTTETIDMLLAENPGLNQIPIRVDKATQQGSVIDVIAMVTGLSPKHASQAYARLEDNISSRCGKLRINGKGRETWVADAPTLIEMIWELPGKAARAFRRQSAHLICRMLGGDLTLASQIEARFRSSTPEQRAFFTPPEPPAVVEEEDAEPAAKRLKTECTDVVVFGMNYVHTQAEHAFFDQLLVINKAENRAKLQIAKLELKSKETDLRAKEVEAATKSKELDIKGKEIDAELKTKELDTELKTKEIDAGLKTKEIDAGLKTKEIDAGLKTKELDLKAKETEAGLKEKEIDAGVKSKELDLGLAQEGNKSKQLGLKAKSLGLGQDNKRTGGTSGNVEVTTTRYTTSRNRSIHNPELVPCSNPNAIRFTTDGAMVPPDNVCRGR